MNEFGERDPNSKRQNFVREEVQFLKSERGRHNPKGDFAAHVLLTLHSHPLPNLLQGVSHSLITSEA